MAINILSTANSSKKEEDEEDEEGYIDLEVSSYPVFHSGSSASPPQHPNPNNREFEFQMSSSSLEGEQPSTSPADELFYKGKLLPLHLPPRLQMVEKLLENSDRISRTTCEEYYGTPLTTSPSTTPVGAYSTPYESCSVSPSPSCAVSRELNPKEYFFECLVDEMSSENPKNSWGKKIKLIRQSLLGSNLKTPKTYLRSFFSKYSCSHESCASNIHQSSTRITKKTESVSINGKFVKRTQNQSLSADGTRSFRKESQANKSQRHRRRSLSGLSKKHSVNKKSAYSSSCSSSSVSSESSLSSNDSNGANQILFLKRSNSRNSEMENPIQGAIKHCKQSQHLGKSVAVFPESV